METLKKELLNLVIEVTQDIANTKESSKPVELDQQAVGRVSRVDAIQQQQMQLAGLQRMEKRLSMIKAALLRIESDLYGDCVQCEEPIELKRLKARPESALCLNCASKR